MTEAFVNGRGAGKTWALCAWLCEDPADRVIVVPNANALVWTQRMLIDSFGAPPDADLPVCTVNALHRVEPHVQYVIDDIGGCMSTLFRPELAGFTATGFNAPDQPSFLRALMVPGG